MIIVKCLILALIFGISCCIGIRYANRYKKRELELKEVKATLKMFQSKIKYTYETIPDIFNEIAKCNGYSSNISNIYSLASMRMENESAGSAWTYALDNMPSNLNEEDKNVLKSLSKMLGKTDLDGQLKEIELTNEFLDYQIKKAESEREKNEKLYKTLGVVVGFGFVILLL